MLMSHASFIQLNHISKTYRGGAGTFTALDQVSLSVERGDHIAIVGKSGSGKTTLLNMLTGIDRPTSGEILVGNTAIHSMSEAELAKWRGKEVGVIFQFYQLFPTLSALDNVRFAMDLVGKIAKANRIQRAKDLLDQVGLADHLHKLPSQLSGGEQQRVAIARALANEPPLLVADEPTGNLDSQTTTQINAIFEHLHQAGQTIITVTHEQTAFSSYDAVYQMHDGHLSPFNTVSEA